MNRRYVTLKGGYTRGMATVSSIKKQMGQYVQAI